MWVALGLWWALAAQSGPAPESPTTLGVLPLSAELEVPSGMANLLTESLVQEVRDHQCFSRVVSFKEVEDAISLEQQRQLVNCSSNACMAEIAGAIGVDFLLGGSVGRIGDTGLLNLKVIESRTGVARASVSERVEWDRGEGVLRNLPAAVRRLLERGAWIAPEVASAPEPSSTPAPAEPVLVAAEPRASSTAPVPVPVVRRGGTPWPQVAGTAAGAAGASLMAAAALLLVVAGTAVVLPTLVAVPAPAMKLQTKKLLFLGTGGLVTVLSVVCALSGVAVLGVGVGGAIGLGRFQE